jgi:hypothetical protein
MSHEDARPAIKKYSSDSFSLFANSTDQTTKNPEMCVKNFALNWELPAFIAVQSPLRRPQTLNKRSSD